jgi:hypothetical protein
VRAWRTTSVGRSAEARGAPPLTRGTVLLKATGPGMRLHPGPGRRSPLQFQGLIGNGAFRITSPGVFQPPRGSGCREGTGACGRDCGTGSGRSTRGSSAGTCSSGLGAGCAAAGVSRRGLGATARVPRFTLGARATVLAFGSGAGLSTRSEADTMSTGSRSCRRAPRLRHPPSRGPARGRRSRQPCPTSRSTPRRPRSAARQ